MKRFLLLVLILPALALARQVTMKTQGNFTPTQTTQLALASNRNRQALVVSNKGTDAVLLKFGNSAAGTTNGIKLAAGANMDFVNAPADNVYVVLAASTGTNVIDILEFE